MTIASALTALNTDIKNARTAITNKGGTVTTGGGSSQLANDIATIPTGGGGGVITSLNVTPSTSVQTITASGGIDGYSPVNVSAVTSSIDNNITASNIKKNVTILGVTGTYEGEEFIGIPREIANGTMQQPAGNHTYTIPDAVTDLGGYALYSAFYGDKKLTRVYGNNLTTVGGVYALASAFQSGTGLLSADFSNVTSLGNTQCMASAFYNCSALTDVDFSGLATITGANAMSTAFRACSSLTELNFPSLVTINASNAFSSICRDCTSLVTFTLPNLQTMTGSSAMANAFQGCSALTNISFPKLKTIGTDNSGTNNSHLSGFLQSSPNITTLTFPELEKIYCNGSTTGSYGTFANNVYLEKLYFPKLNTITYGTGASAVNKNACKNTFYGCSALTELHFAAANQSAIEATDGYSTAWGRGAGNVTIYFDL